MAVFEGDEAEDAPLGVTRRVQRATGMAGAVMSVSLIAGLAVWGYQIAVRDAHGVPVVRALEGPMRIAPADPGGDRVAHQGLAVNAVAAVGEVAAPADRLVLAPAPVSLSDADQPGFAPTPAAALVPVAAVLSPDPLPDEGSSSAALEEVPAAAPLTDAERAAAMAASLPESVDNAPAEIAGTEAAASGVAAPPPLDPAADPAVLTEAAVDAAVAEAIGAALPVAEPVDVLPASVPGLATSPRPVPRPAREGVEAAAEVAASGPAEIDAASLPVGTRLVQLGAFDDIPSAEAEWARVQARFAAYFDGKGRIIQEAEQGGRTFYRLRVHGFGSEDDARRFCSVLMAERAVCIPVLIR